MNTLFLSTHVYGEITGTQQTYDFIHEHVVKAHALIRVLLALHQLQRISASNLYDYLWTVDEQIGLALSQSVAESFIHTQHAAANQSPSHMEEIYKILARVNVRLGSLLRQQHFFEGAQPQLLTHLHQLDEELENLLFYCDESPSAAPVHERKPSH